jgi:SAM-dependent methyltransferase
MPDFAALTAVQKAVWDAGDWAEFAPLIADASRVVIDRLGVAEGHEFLDVGTGSGTAAILAARRGARATGLDLVPKLIAAAQARAQAEGVEVTWVVGDAQDLPFGDGSFDRVSSVFGCMFAPDQERAAAELVRVCRPGGRITVSAWTPEGLNGQTFGVVGKYFPPPPEGVRPPVMWGTEDHVRHLFSGHSVETERVMLRWKGDSFDEFVANFEVLGPMVMARAALEPQGKWEAAREDVLDVYRRQNRAGEGGIDVESEYLVTTVTP